MGNVRCKVERRECGQSKRRKCGEAKDEQNAGPLYHICSGINTSISKCVDKGGGSVPLFFERN